MIAPCLPPFAHATFLEPASFEETVEAAVDLALMTGSATISGRALALEESYPRQALARVLYHDDGTPRSPEEIVDEMPF